jgi:hypothetical protein
VRFAAYALLIPAIGWMAEATAARIEMRHRSTALSRSLRRTAHLADRARRSRRWL